MSPLGGALTLFKCVSDEEEEEQFLESLPSDMLEDEDLQQISSMAQRPSFITRDLSDW